MRQLKTILLIISFFSCGLEVFAQNTISNSDQKKILRQARNYMYAGEYTEAFELYSQLYKADSTNMVYNYELGITIYDGSPRNKLASKKHFEKVYESGERDEKPELFYYLGRLYHLEHNFLFALGAYNTYLVEGLPPGNFGKAREAEVQSYIQQCEEGKSLIEQKAYILEGAEKETRDVTRYDIDSTKYISFENLGEELNSSFDEYGPIIMDNNQVLLFTSRREGSTGGELYSDGQYYEDIYIANFRNGIWAESNNINNTDYFNGALVNTAEHNATVSISPDESQIFTYTQNHCDRSVNDGSQWLEIEKFSEKFNRAGNYVPNVTISPDGKTLFVEAVRYDSYGGRDIYKCTLQDDGEWGEMQNLGPNVNTELDEVSPFLFNDSTLYFSSKGHTSIGGWDVFRTVRTKDGWSKPENLGIPINTPYDEVNYMQAYGDTTKAYYSSNREGGYGGFDIYAIIETVQRDIDEEMLKKLTEVDTLPPKVIVMDQVQVDQNGKLTAASLNELNKNGAELNGNPNSTIQITAIANTKEQAKKNAEAAAAVLIAQGISEDRISLRYLSQAELDAMNKKSDGPLEAKYEQVVYFGLDSKLITDYSKEKKMAPLLEYLKDKPDVKIYLSGHADHVGRSEYNLELSKQRTISVEQFLRANGVNNPVRAEYFGESSPRYATEDVMSDPSKQIYNRRVKIVIF